jgi:nuclear transport factor 2 (NTF2) superfamily protein
MKRTAIFLCLFFIGVISPFGCTQPEKNQVKNLPNADLHQFSNDYATAWSSQDAAHFAFFYAADGALKINDAEPAKGREAIAALAQSYMTALPDMIVSFDSLLVEDDSIRFHWTLDATHSGPGGTGNRIHISGYEEWTRREDGLIVLSQGYMDSDEYQRQVEFGVSKD